MKKTLTTKTLDEQMKQTKISIEEDESTLILGPKFRWIVSIRGHESVLRDLQWAR